MKIQFVIVGWHFDTSVAGDNYINWLIELQKNYFGGLLLVEQNSELFDF